MEAVTNAADHVRWIGREGTDDATSGRVLAALPVAIYVTDQSGALTSYNGAAAELWGFQPELGDPAWWRPWHLYRLDGSPLPYELSPMAVAMREHRHIPGEEVLAQHSAGEIVPLLAYSTLLHEDGGGLIGAINTLVDLNDARQTALALRERDEHYRHIVDFNPQLLWISDAEGRVIDVGGRWLLSTGLEREQALGDEWLAICHPDDVPRVGEARRASMINGRPYDVEYRARTAKGHYHWVHSRGYPRRNADGEIIFWYGTTEDIDARVRAELKRNQLEVEIRHATRVNALGQMAGMLAHELSQPLAAAANYLDGCDKLLERTEAPQPATIGRAIDRARQQIDHASAVLARLRLFIRNEAPKSQSTTLNQAVMDAVQLATAGNANRMGIALDLDLDVSNPIVRADPVEIQQVVLNLVRNAIEAMEGEPRRNLRVATQTERDAAHIIISDTGRGADIAIEDMFEPFLTTKTNGLGLGLAICRRIVELYGGAIWAEVNPDAGLTMRARLPLSAVD